MNISKKAFMSFIMALTSLVAMAQPYYHVMKRDGSNLTEEAINNAKTYKIRVDMNEPKPKDAIGGKITIESDYGCNTSPLKHSFYFTKKGNVYYDFYADKFFFEKSQLDYPRGWYDMSHCGHFLWGKSITDCISSPGKKEYLDLGWPKAREKDFYFANPDNLPRLQEDLGYERWAVLSYCEWDYVLENLGESGWLVDGETCFLIDTTPGKSLLSELHRKKSGKISRLSIEEFKSLEAKGLVCLPASGVRIANEFYDIGGGGHYWSCTPADDNTAYSPLFDLSGSGMNHSGYRGTGGAVRLVILAD